MLRCAMVLCVILPVTCGCGGSGRPKLAPVTGVVNYNGEPLSEGMITFQPEEGRSASGKIVDGAITEVTTFDPKDGAPVGTHIVTVSAIPNAEDMFADHTSLIPLKYADPKKSGLSATIEAGASNHVEIELTDEK